jgi:hypothetical protein
MMKRRMDQCLLLIGLISLSWLGMMAVHEAGHVTAAWATGGVVQRVVFHPLTLSRTDVWPNPHPMVVLWAGPLAGTLLPAIPAAAMRRRHSAVGDVLRFFAGFCLIANGVYIGLGTFHPVGDAADMLRLGTPRWGLAGFGLAAVLPGLWLLHKASPALGFGRQPTLMPPKPTYVVFAIAVMTFALACAFGNRHP